MAKLKAIRFIQQVDCGVRPPEHKLFLAPDETVVGRKEKHGRKLFTPAHNNGSN